MKMCNEIKEKQIRIVPRLRTQIYNMFAINLLSNKIKQRIDERTYTLCTRNRNQKGKQTKLNKYQIINK